MALAARFDAQAAQRAIERVQADKDAFELVYTSMPSWPHAESAARADAKRPSNIAILDSSFNPPHFAHLAIASSSLPPPIAYPSVDNEEQRPSRDQQSSKLNTYEAPAYSARLLVFSVRNIEKTPKEGDATVMQRLEMTVLLAETLSDALVHSQGSGSNGDAKAGDEGRVPVAVGILNEPTFVGKSRIIHRFLREWQARHTSGDAEGIPSAMRKSETQPAPAIDQSTPPRNSPPTLTFLIGTDTLTRFFEPKFYPQGMDTALQSFFGSPSHRLPQSGPFNSERLEEGGEGGEGDGSILVSARRGTSDADRALEQTVLEGQVAAAWASAGRVRLLGDGSEGWEEISSTRIRKAVGEGDWEEAGKLMPARVLEYVRGAGLYRSTVSSKE